MDSNELHIVVSDDSDSPISQWIARQSELSHEYSHLKKEIRSYEVSLWTLQDEFITVLKWSDAMNIGRIQNPLLELSTTAASKFTFSIPMYYREEGKLIPNPNWYTVQEGKLIANMRKIKIIFNKSDEDKDIFELLINKVSEKHDQGQLTCEVTCEDLAFNEIGRVGYKIELSDKVFEAAYEDWENSTDENKPKDFIQSIDFWCEQIGLPNYYESIEDDHIVERNYHEPRQWYYRVEMNWSSFANGYKRNPHRIYEEAYATSWDENLNPKAVENYREKARPVVASKSNIYNITQTIAKAFEVYCRYEYDYDENYHIVGRTVVFYNNFLYEDESPLGIIYPYSASKITREIDSADITSKLYVLDGKTTSGSDEINFSILNTEANMLKEDYILDFDYMYRAGAINEEQYKSLQDFKKAIRALNEELIPLQQNGIAYETFKTEYEGKQTFYENSIANATEQIAQNQASINAVLIKDGDPETGLIERGTNNPDYKVVMQDDETGQYYINLSSSQKGIVQDTVGIYRNRNGKTLSGQITTSYYFEQDEYGNPTKIVGPGLEPEADLENPNATRNNTVYLTYSYKPSLYYERILNVWKAKLAKDTESKEYYDNLLLGYDEDNTHINGLYEIIEANNARIDELLNQKKELIDDLNHMMGAAMREGYWQPEDYTDYGQAYQMHTVLDENSEFEDDKHIRCAVGWDTTPFDDDESIIYKYGVLENEKVYPCVDLTLLFADNQGNVQIPQNISEYSFIYNQRFDGTDYTNDLTKVAIWHIDASCKICFQKITIPNTNIQQIHCMLVLTAAKSLSDTEITNLLDCNKSKPMISKIETQVDNQQQDVIQLKLSDDSKPILSDMFFQPQNTIALYPRIRFGSTMLKTDPQSLKIRFQNILLQDYEDYNIRTRYNKYNESYYFEYYVAIKPETLIKHGTSTNGVPSYQGNLDFVYTISNGCTAIYLDALKVSKENSVPKVSYSTTISVLGTEIARTLYKRLAQLVIINDTDLKLENTFGYISSLKLNLDDVTKDTIEIKNYKNKFEDLFSSIVASTEAIKANELALNSALSGRMPLAEEGLAASLTANSTAMNNYLDSYFGNSYLIQYKLTGLFKEAGQILSDANKPLNQVRALTLENASILGQFAEDIRAGITPVISKQPEKPLNYKPGDIWIQTDTNNKEIARYVATSFVGEDDIHTPDENPENDTRGFVRTYDGTLASIRGAHIDMDTVAGILELEAGNSINLKSGGEVDIRANTNVNILGNKSVNIGGTRINIASQGSLNDEDTGIYIVSSGMATLTSRMNTAFDERTDQANVINDTLLDTASSHVYIKPKEVNILSGRIKLRGTNSIDLATNNQGNIAAIKLSPQNGVWIGSNQGIRLFTGGATYASGTDEIESIDGANVELNATHLLFGFSNINSNGTNASALEMTGEQILLAVGSAIDTIKNQEQNHRTVDDIGTGLTGMKITKTSFGLATWNDNTANMILANNDGILIGTKTGNQFSSISQDIKNPSTGESYVKLSGSGIILSSGADLYINTTNFKVDTTATTTNNIFYVGNSSAYLAYSLDNGLTVIGKGTFTGSNGKFIADGNHFGLYKLDGTTGILTVTLDNSNNAILTSNGSLTISSGGNFTVTSGITNISSTNFVVNSAATGSAILFKAMNGTSGISVDGNGNTTISGSGVFNGTIYATGGTFSGTITANGTISGGEISGATLTAANVTCNSLNAGGLVYDGSSLFLDGAGNFSAISVGSTTMINSDGLFTGNAYVSSLTIGTSTITPVSVSGKSQGSASAPSFSYGFSSMGSGILLSLRVGNSNDHVNLSEYGDVECTGDISCASLSCTGFSCRGAYITNDGDVVAADNLKGVGLVISGTSATINGKQIATIDQIPSSVNLSDYALKSEAWLTSDFQISDYVTSANLTTELKPMKDKLDELDAAVKALQGS